MSALRVEISTELRHIQEHSQAIKVSTDRLAYLTDKLLAENDRMSISNGEACDMISDLREALKTSRALNDSFRDELTQLKAPKEGYE